MPCDEPTPILNAQPQPPKPSSRRLSWAYGITTVPSRRDDLLPRTLLSLREAGFGYPRLFVDGGIPEQAWGALGLEVTYRYPTVRTYANWVLSLWEIYAREPNADRYAIFQDDFVTYRNLRQYLDACPYPAKGYWNLYTFPSNEGIVPKDDRGQPKTGWYKSNQFGRGAVALVFDRDAVQQLLQSPHIVERPTNAQRGHKAVDGAIVTALGKVGISEFVHYPSLVQHVGDVSSMGNKPHLKAHSFRGEEFDAMALIDGGK